MSQFTTTDIKMAIMEELNKFEGQGYTITLLEDQVIQAVIVKVSKGERTMCGAIAKHQADKHGWAVLKEIDYLVSLLERADR